MTPDFPELAAIRLGYGLSPTLPPPDNPRAVLDDVARVAALPPVHDRAGGTTPFLRMPALEKTKNDAVAAGGDGMAEEKAINDYRGELTRVQDTLLRQRLLAAATAPIGFGERLVQFWMNHFTVIPRTPRNIPMAAAFIEEAIRPNIGGTFLQLFTAAETHPAMLLYLEQNNSIGERSLRAAQSREKVGVNENLAREMLELHSLGVGANYSQDDVRQLAYLLTGLSFDAREPDTIFNSRLAQPGAETIFGKHYGGRRGEGMNPILEAFADIVSRPEAGRFIARKLAGHFVSDIPDEGLVADLASAWGKDGDLPALYAVLVQHPQLAATFRQKVRQPFDFLAASLRALAVDPAAIEALPRNKARRWFARPMEQMGQPFMRPIGPDGWKEAGSAWVNPQLLTERIDWAMNAPKVLLDELPDPRSFLDVALGPTASEALAWAVPRAESISDGLGVVLASNDFNRR